MAFVKKIISITLSTNGNDMLFDVGFTKPVSLSCQWMQVNKPSVGDYLVHCHDGFYHVVKPSIVRAIVCHIMQK